MNRKILFAVFSSFLISISFEIIANEKISEEDQQRILDRMKNISIEDQQRINQRFSDVQPASKAQADKASEGSEKANPACEVVLCMFGKMKGSSPSQCKSAEKKYFSILSKKKGKIRWDRTARDRLNFLNKCPSPENDAINKKFGRVLG